MSKRDIEKELAEFLEKEKKLEEDINRMRTTKFITLRMNDKLYTRYKKESEQKGISVHELIILKLSY